MRKAFLSVLFFPTLVLGSCKLPEKETIKVGCTYQCGIAYKLRLKVASMITGLPVEIIDMNTNMSLMNSMDAILIPGGADIHPRLYEELVDDAEKKLIAIHKDKFRASDEGAARDIFEFQVLKKYQSENRYSKTPLLGICRGMQMMGVSQGLPLYQDIESELKIPNREYVIDEVSIPKGPTMMSSIFPSGEFYASKLHHQGIKGSYYYNKVSQFPHIKLTAFSHKKRIVEAIEFTNRPALGVQFHPEMSLPNNIFEWFLNKACEKKIQFTKDGL